MSLELVPIGTILTVLTKLVTKTAQAAMDVVIEKDSFKVLSKHLFNIEPVLKELQLKKLNESQAARQALELLEADVKKAGNVIDKYNNRSSFYLLFNCQSIVKEVQEVTRDLGRSLASLSLASVDLLSGISDQVNRLQNEMQRVDLEASHSQLQIIEKINKGIADQACDQGFANDMLEEIARAVGIPVEPSDISKELASFRKEKEEAANRKERAELFFLEQVIELLSRADAARDYEEIKKQYEQRVQAIERYNEKEECIRPLKAFICCINATVMVDPVSLCTGTTCERAAVEARFSQGDITDPETGQVLEDTSFRSNLPLRKSIEEWRERNYCLMIRSSKGKLSSGKESLVKEALQQLQNLMRENSVNKDWISIGGLTELIVSILANSHSEVVRRKILITLKDLVEGHPRNKEILIESKGWDHIIPCLIHDQSVSEAAVELLFELLQDKSGWNVSACSKFSQQYSGILFLVTLINGPVTESAEYAEKILRKLFEVNEENYCHAAKAGWFKPLVERIIQGPEPSRLSMTRALDSMELIESNLILLGEEGVISPLLEMASGNLESKELSLSALVKLIDCHANKKLLAEAGGIPLILNLTFSSHMPTVILVKCSRILEKLASGGDGIEFFVDETGTKLDLDKAVASLLDFLQNVHLSNDIRRPGMHALLGMCKFNTGIVKAAVLSVNGVSIVLSLLDDSDLEIQEIATQLLFLFSQHETDGIVDYLLKARRLEALVSFLDNSDKSDVQMAVTGLLANLPKSEQLLTKKLIELEGLDAILKILRTGTIEAIENSLSALFRFTDPMDLESQNIVVERGAYPLLVKSLTSDSVIVKARAAALIGDLSANSLKLTTINPKPYCYWCFCRSRVPLCRAHGGICSVTTTFCILEAKALPDLVDLLKEEVHATAYEAIQTLSTLVMPGNSHLGVDVLHEADAIKPILKILNWGTDSLKDEALTILERILTSKEMVDCYGSAARLVLVGLTSRNLYEEGHLRRKAIRVLSLIERYSRSSTSLIQGLFSGNL